MDEMDVDSEFEKKPAFDPTLHVCFVLVIALICRQIRVCLSSLFALSPHTHYALRFPQNTRISAFQAYAAFGSRARKRRSSGAYASVSDSGGNYARLSQPQNSGVIILLYYKWLVTDFCLVYGFKVRELIRNNEALGPWLRKGAANQQQSTSAQI